jgi:hypothetical protein
MFLQNIDTFLPNYAASLNRLACGKILGLYSGGAQFKSQLGKKHVKLSL